MHIDKISQRVVIIFIVLLKNLVLMKIAYYNYSCITVLICQYQSEGF
jgi:hypothetical protein